MYVLPVVISFMILAFIYFRKRSEIEFSEMIRDSEFVRNDSEKNDNIEKLVVRGDIELRVLEEITETDSQPFFYSGRGKPRRELILEKLQRALRKVLRGTVESENFTEIKVRVISLLDEISNELKEIRQKIPFDGLDDPERSLLIDLIEEIPTDKEIPQQKAQQLADIIKVKHQNIKKLQLENARSAGWTRWGTVGTVSFGLLSLALSIYTIYT